MTGNGEPGSVEKWATLWAAKPGAPTGRILREADRRDERIACLAALLRVSLNPERV